MKELTERQRDILDWIVGFAREHGMPPTVREIGAEFGISPAGVFGHLKALERKGRLRRGELGARSLEIVGMPASGRGESAAIPVVGRIAAGAPLLAVENVEGSLAVDPSMLRPRGGQFFALRVKGDSMVEAGILDGDIVIVHKRRTAADGDIVVALIGEEATVKRFYRERRRVRLEPANSRMKPIFVKDVVVQGVVKGLVRRLY